MCVVCVNLGLFRDKEKMRDEMAFYIYANNTGINNSFGGNKIINININIIIFSGAVGLRNDRVAPTLHHLSSIYPKKVVNVCLTRSSRPSPLLFCTA